MDWKARKLAVFLGARGIALGLMAISTPGCFTSAAAELQGFRKWSTMGQSSGGGAWAVLLMEVEKTPMGSIARMVYAGFGDACRRVTIREWEKQMDGMRPEDLARPADLCQVTQAGIERETKMLGGFSAGIEEDVLTLIVFCDGGKSAISLPVGLPPLLRENESGSSYLNALFGLEGSVSARVWNGWPIPPSYDSEAEERGRIFAGLARARKYADEQEAFARFLAAYRGPIGKPAHQWKVEFPAGLKAIQLSEPPSNPSFLLDAPLHRPVQLRLSIAVKSGKVSSSKLLEEDNPVNEMIRRASLGWVFDPSTVPIGGIVTAAVEFDAACPERQ